MTEAIGWIATVLAVSGVWLNNRRRRICFVVWMISNAITAVLHAHAGLTALLVRDIIFFALAIEGFYRWK